MSSLIFLDIDGVLNGHDWSKTKYSRLIRESCVKELNRIIETANPVFVLSSAWRYQLLKGATTHKGFEYMLLTHGVSDKFRLVSHTCSDETIDEDGNEVSQRGQQISRWLNEHTVTVPYVVIDDLDLGITEAGHPFVKTDSNVGLTRKEADLAIEILTSQ